MAREWIESYLDEISIILGIIFYILVIRSWNLIIKEILFKVLYVSHRKEIGCIQELFSVDIYPFTIHL